MVLKLNHFDTKTKQDMGTEEKLENTLAQYLFPNVEFSIGTAYPEATIPQDLQEHNGMTLQFCTGKRMIYASDPNIRSMLYPNPSDGAAYPLPFTPCRNFHELENVRILVVDDATGENGGVIAISDAIKMVGDCKGLIDKDFAISNNIRNRAFQFRLGIKPQAESPVMRIAKGTLAPARLDKLGNSFFSTEGNLKDGTFRSKFGCDMVIATSSFKGRRREDAIQPGKYILSIGLGVKALALYREHSLGTQFLVNYPHAVKNEILPIIKQQAEQLAHEQKDLKKLAQRYIETYEKRKALLSQNLELDNDTLNEKDEFNIFDDLDSEEDEVTNDGDNLNNTRKDLLFYSLLKADVNNYCQLIEHPKIVSELQDFVRKQWVDIATGRSIKFASGLAQPSLELKCDEISIPYLDENEEIIVTRSPLINSNGAITLKNKHLREVLDGCVYIHPKTAMDNMQCDFDGDLLAFAPSKDFPQLASEVKRLLKAENRYPDIVKKDKIPYQGTFEEIAVYSIDNKIGIIANEIQKNLALQSEICAMPQSEKLDYLKNLLKHFNKLFKQYQQRKLAISDKIVEQIKPIASTNINSIDSVELEKNLHQVKSILFDCVAHLSNELQVAADGPKSALRPDSKIINYCQKITDYKEVEWLTDKKNPEAFTHQGMKSNGYSPIDLMIQQTNQIFQQSQIVARPIEQFRKLYPSIESNHELLEKAKEIKSCYNSDVKQRIQLEEWKKLEQGPYLTITSPLTGKQLEVTNLISFDIAKKTDFWQLAKLSICIESRKPSKNMPHVFKATIKSTNADGKEINMTIGTISMKSMREHTLKPGMTINQGEVEFHFGISDGMIDVLKQQTLEYLESIRDSTPENDKLQLAAAIHDISHTEENKNYSGLKKAGVAFAIFPLVVISQLDKLQFTQMRILGTQFNDYADNHFIGEKVAIKFENGINPRDPTKTARWVMVEGKKLGTIDATSPHLLAGCEAVATITSPVTTSVIVSSLKNPDNKLQIDNVDKYAFESRQWQGEQANITLVVGQNNSRKTPTVFAKLDNQVLGVVNKKSVNFLQEKLAAAGKSIQEFTFSGTLKNARASYADIVIDPNSVKFPESHKNVCTVLFFETPVDSALQQKTQQMMSNMLKRAVERAVELGYETVQFVDVSTNPTESSVSLRTIEQLAAEYKNINVDFIGSASVED
ncbi:MAG: hypothetical protein HC874_27950, partial [Richelia sp. SL_2_1]|nr:hypothetical protein [Richelia sp. SL_2_1]